MIVVGCLSVFEAEATLRKCLRSITPFVDRIIAIDGAYAGFSDHIASQDGTEVLIRGFQKPYILQRAPPSFFRSEMAKRNQYLFERYLDEGDWAFIIDADEYIESGVEETLDFLQDSKEPYHSVHTVHPDKNLPDYARSLGDRVRLIKYASGMKYRGNHYTIVTASGSQIPLQAMPTPLTVVHDDHHVSEAYKKALDDYNRNIRPTLEKP